MKRNGTLRIWLFTLFLLFSGAITGQVRVEEKPIPPRVRMKMPSKPGPDYVLLPGRWIWNRPARMYAWIGPVWVIPPKGRVWSPGYWKPVKNGWVWVPGKWQRKTGFLHRKNKTLNS